MEHAVTFVTESDRPAWSRLQEHIDTYMLGANRMFHEFLLIGTFRDASGKEAKHASTFIRIDCGKRETPVVVHLDANCDHPQSTDPMLLGGIYSCTVLLWQLHFERYSEISLYRLVTNHLPDEDEFTRRLNFIKEIIEGRPPAAVDASERHEEFSHYGSLGRQASSRSRRKFGTKPKKSQPRSQPGRRADAADSSIDSSSSESEAEEGTLDYFEDQQGKQTSINHLTKCIDVDLAQDLEDLRLSSRGPQT